MPKKKFGRCRQSERGVVTTSSPNKFFIDPIFTPDQLVYLDYASMDMGLVSEHFQNSAMFARPAKTSSQITPRLDIV